MTERPDITEAAKSRILVLDGAMGTMIQQEKPDEATYRGDRFKDHGQDVGGNNELLSLTQPDMIRRIHEDFTAAGADILCTNTFGANRISQADYGMEELSREMNLESVKLARAAADAAGRPVWVAGAIGPPGEDPGGDP